MDNNDDTPQTPDNKPGNGNDGDARRTSRQVLEDIREHGLLGGLGVPGIRQLNNVITYTIIGGVVAVAGAIGTYFIHGAIDNSYQDEYKASLKTVADKSARVCGLDQAERQESLYTTVYDDVLGSRKQGLLNRLPLVGGWMPSLEWLPSKRLRDTVNALEKNQVSLYPATITDGFKDGVSAVLYNDGKGAVLAYRDLGDNQLGLMMDALQKQGGFRSGNVVLAWNDAIDEYETVTVAPGAATFTMKTGKFTPVAVPVNPCFNQRSLTGKLTESTGEAIDKAKEKTKETIKDWTPTMPSLPSLPWKGDDNEPAIPATDNKAVDEAVKEKTVKDETVTEEPAQEEKKGGWRTYLPSMKNPF